MYHRDTPLKRLKLILFLIFLIFVVGVAKDLFLQLLLQNGITQATGLRTSVATLHFSLLSSHAEAKEILLYNPKDFEDPIFARISDLFFEIDPLALLKGEPHFLESQFVLEELFLIKNRSGVSNVARLMNTVSQRGGEGKTPLQIDRLDFAVLRIITKNYQTSPPTVREFYPDIHHERLEGLQGLRAAVHGVLSKTLTHPSVSSLAATEFGDLQEKR